MRYLALVFAPFLLLIAAGAAFAQGTTPSPCPAGETITVTPPTASAPTTVTASVTPMLNLKAASDADPTSFHLHYFVDIDPTMVLQPGQPIPQGNPKIIHTASTSQDVGPLTPGSHTVWVVLAQVNHVPCSPNVQGQVTFTVSAAAGQAAGTASTGTAGTASGQTTTSTTTAATTSIGVAGTTSGQTGGATSTAATATAEPPAAGQAGGCQPGDSWCSYCMDHPGADMCKAFPPAQAKS
jgi:hypothetical protein